MGVQISSTQNEKSRNSEDNKDVKKTLRRGNEAVIYDEYDPIPDINISPNPKRSEMLKLQNWEDECFYNCVKYFFKGGTQHQLRFNELIRDICKLGEPRSYIDDDEPDYESTGRRD